MPRYDALLVVSFGGPERHEDVIPFLENVLRGRNVPRERMLEVAEHYYHFDGRSPINDQNRALVDALKHRLEIPVYWGNRNWHPMLADTIGQMQADGIRRALAFTTSAFGSYSGCRQYQENINAARSSIGAKAPVIDKIPPFSDNPNFLEAMASRVRDAMFEDSGASLIFTAHSIPISMSDSSPYVQQLEHACTEVARAVNVESWTLAYQSRSGPPSQPWLDPDISDHLRALAAERVRRVVIAPIGFLSDHMEVIYDLDTEARALCYELGIEMRRASTVETHPKMIDMIEEMVEAYSFNGPPACRTDCCAPARRPAQNSTTAPAVTVAPGVKNPLS